MPRYLASADGLRLYFPRGHRLLLQIKPLLVQAAWAAVRAGPDPGPVQPAGPQVRRVQEVLKAGTPYADLGAGYYDSRESAQARQDYLVRQLQKLNPGRVITITPPETA
jgi:hypothetical protein